MGYYQQKKNYNKYSNTYSNDAYNREYENSEYENSEYGNSEYENPYRQLHIAPSENNQESNFSTGNSNPQYRVTYYQRQKNSSNKSNGKKRYRHYSEVLDWVCDVSLSAGFPILFVDGVILLWFWNQTLEYDHIVPIAYGVCAIEYLIFFIMAYGINPIEVLTIFWHNKAKSLFAVVALAFIFLLSNLSVLDMVNSLFDYHKPTIRYVKVHRKHHYVERGKRTNKEHYDVYVTSWLPHPSPKLEVSRIYFNSLGVNDIVDVYTKPGFLGDEHWSPSKSLKCKYKLEDFPEGTRFPITQEEAEKLIKKKKSND